MQPDRDIVTPAISTPSLKPKYMTGPNLKIPVFLTSFVHPHGWPHDPPTSFFWHNLLVLISLWWFITVIGSFVIFFLFFSLSFWRVIVSTPIQVDFCPFWGSSWVPPQHLRLKPLLWCLLMSTSPFITFSRKIFIVFSILWWKRSFWPFWPFLPFWGWKIPPSGGSVQSQIHSGCQSEGPSPFYQPNNVFWLLAPYTFMTRGHFWYGPPYPF